MPRDERAYLSDILESCEAIAAAVQGIDLAAYQSTRLIRSAVKREFIIIGEAVAALGGAWRRLAASRQPHSRRLLGRGELSISGIS